MAENRKSKLRVFISSVQKELEPERLALFGLITTDPFLKEHLEPILFEKLPPPPRPMEKAYLKVLETCELYVLMLDREYGLMEGKYSATHHKYNMARKKNMPSCAMIKGRHDEGREGKTQSFIKKIKSDRFTYKRFIDRIDLKKEVSAWFLQVVKEKIGVDPEEGVTYNTAYRDLSELVVRGLLIQRGKGRATRYEINFERE